MKTGTKGSWVEVTAWNFHEITSHISSLLKGRKIELLCTENYDVDSRQATPLSRQQGEVTEVTSGSSDEQKWFTIHLPSRKTDLSFAISGSSSWTVPYLSVFIDEQSRTVQLMKPTVPGWGLWIFSY